MFNRAALVCAALVALSGCATVKPDALTAGYWHLSQPFQGDGPPPVGNHSRTAETNADAITIGAEWTRGRGYATMEAGYSPHNANLAGDNWIFSARVGIRVKLP